MKGIFIMAQSTPADASTEGATSTPSNIVAIPAVAKRAARRPTYQRFFNNGTIAAAVMVLAAIAAVIVANTDAFFPVHSFLRHHSPFRLVHTWGASPSRGSLTIF